ncbi:actin-related protein 6-like [Diaphorina citri]|uniref:Actin-related protein 6-like n=1 Tax=Diaphorina citri TaxID=121845 RepID=A0A3Q0IW94_DIACI|nr:actin-related protein 6-like [Diaphorina citri]
MNAIHMYRNRKEGTFYTIYRQLHVMDETHVINQVKEDSCFVSQNFYQDMEIARRKDSDNNTIVREYVLPDYTTLKRGYLRKPGSEKNDQKPSPTKSQNIVSRAEVAKRIRLKSLTAMDTDEYNQFGDLTTQDFEVNAPTSNLLLGEELLSALEFKT